MRMKPTPNSKSGVWLLDKPPGVSSRLLLNQFCQQLSIQDAGHTGTLDPLASGLLVVLSGTARRVQDLICHGFKCYDAQIQLGATSVTDDAEGPITPHPVSSIPPLPQIQEVLNTFLGDITQIPPPYSALKIDGQRAYKLARRGQTPQIKPRTIHIQQIILVKYEFPQLYLQISCSAGTYIRSLARDIGIKLGCGGYIQQLRRVASGQFHIQQAKLLEDIQEADMISLDQSLAAYPRIELPDSFWFAVRNGQRLAIEKLSPEYLRGLFVPAANGIVPAANGNESNILENAKDVVIPSCIIWIQNKAVALACIHEGVVQVQRMLRLELGTLPCKTMPDMIAASLPPIALPDDSPEKDDETG